MRRSVSERQRTKKYNAKKIRTSLLKSIIIILFRFEYSENREWPEFPQRTEYWTPFRREILQSNSELACFVRWLRKELALIYNTSPRYRTVEVSESIKVSEKEKQSGQKSRSRHRILETGRGWSTQFRIDWVKWYVIQTREIFFEPKPRRILVNRFVVNISVSDGSSYKKRNSRRLLQGTTKEHWKNGVHISEQKARYVNPIGCGNPLVFFHPKCCRCLDASNGEALVLPGVPAVNVRRGHRNR